MASEGIARSQTPPQHTVFSSRQITTAGFSSFRPKDVKTGSHTVAWNCDGRKLVSCGFDKSVRIWSPTTLDERSSTTLTANVNNVINCVASNPIHPDLFCGASRLDKKLVLWDYRQKSATQVLDIDGEVVQIQYSPDGQVILAQERGDESKHDCIAIYNASTGAEQGRTGGSSIGLGNSIYQTTFNHTGSLIFVAGGTGSVAILDYPTLDLAEKITGHIKSCHTVSLDPRGRYVATGGADALVNVYDLQEWICLRTISNAESTVVACAFSFDGEWIASASESNYIDITETETGLHNTRIPGRGVTTSLAWHPSQQVLASAGGERKMDGWISLFGQ